MYGALTNFWKVLQDETMFGRFLRRVQAIPFSRQEWEDALTVQSVDQVDCAVAFFVNCRQSLAGRGEEFASWSRTRTRSSMNEQASAWLNALSGLPEVHARLKRVGIENTNALELIPREDGASTFYYCDPPYLGTTRVATETYGPFEMSTAEHTRLLKVLAGIQGKFLLSGYRSDLYDHHATVHGWDRKDFDMANHASGGKTKRRMVECLWGNFELGANE
jgi:DNA adenine methylase